MWSDARRLFDRPRAVLIALLLGAAAFFVFNLVDPFISDDWHHLWIAAHRSQPLFGYFFTNYEGTTSGGSYRPFVNVLWAVVDAAGGGLSLSGRVVGHAFPLVAHLACVALIFAVGRRLVAGRAGTALGALAAALFAVFPNHSEAVIWVGAASDPIATAAVLAGMLLYLDGRAAARLRWFHLVGPAAALAAGLLAKETALVLPAVIALHALFALRRPLRPAVTRVAAVLAPLAVVGLAYLLVRYRATGLLYGYYGAERISLDVMVAARTFLAIPVSHLLAGEWRTAVMDVVYRTVDTHGEAYLLAALVPVALILARARRIVWWLTASFFMAIVPVMQFGLNHLPGRWSDEGERYGYMPSAFAALLLAWGWLWLWQKSGRRVRPWLMVGVCVLILALGVQLAVKNALWLRASRFAEEIAHSWPTETAEQVFVYGLPDNLRGVPLWRNGFAQRLEAEGKRPADLRISDIRTVVDAEARFEIERRECDTLWYRSLGQKNIVGPLTDTPTSFGRLNGGSDDFFVYALTYRNFDWWAQLRFVPSEPRALAAYWTGDGWKMAGRPERLYYKCSVWKGTPWDPEAFPDSEAVVE